MWSCCVIKYQTTKSTYCFHCKQIVLNVFLSLWLTCTPVRLVEHMLQSTIDMNKWNLWAILRGATLFGDKHISNNDINYIQVIVPPPSLSLSHCQRYAVKLMNFPIGQMFPGCNVYKRHLWNIPTNIWWWYTSVTICQIIKSFCQKIVLMTKG